MADLLTCASASPLTSHEADAIDGETIRKASKVLNISTEMLVNLKEEAISYALAHGLTFGREHLFTHIPLTILPVPFPLQEFHHGIILSPLYGKLVDLVSRDINWLHDTLTSVVEDDSFTLRLLELSKSVHSEGILQKTYFGIHRSDYMLHEPKANAKNKCRLLQVELNTIACSFGSLSTKACEMHRFLLGRYGSEIKELDERYKKADYSTRLPRNEALSVIPQAMAKAHQLYGVEDAIVLFVVQPNETNSIDQRCLEYELWKSHRIRVVRKSLSDIATRASLVDIEQRKNALLMEEKEIAVVYFRAGYTPNDYATDMEWTARTVIERSLAIKCPSIAYHLAGTKKVQQVLSQREVLNRFISDEHELELLHASFAGLYGLEHDDQANLDRLRLEVSQNPSAYVLKPQREGGGNNLYGNDVVNAMCTFEPHKLASFILMDRIYPRQIPAVLLRDCSITSGPTLSELGMFITSIFDENGEAIMNCHAGHLLRTKLYSTNEGGVASGFSVLSSPLLIEE
ncbi:unnamed protein product [Albugo candida]|uniref:Glutathione synthetase n=1 Tax=Albugo candida TaxID=65357 RepID=A0A024GKJ1_9STRA|nr:unnamed protein product [Albugo candida]|eukprot:CCI47249.1 unnamed protein product [Albugo candida]